MKSLIATALAAATIFSSMAAADAREGCGRGFHRGAYGHCRANRGQFVVGGPRVGIFYHGRGWWDGHRYWQHRERRHDGWRYR